ncbi:MAG: UDP-N-acetylenolpyruvoylglucosamine reductase [Acidobacteria bacterium]|nr:MAG: UDP-N-acetylenolpyruvoylglucosamine reductase [Acidobacteriota bacterium]
MFPDKYNVQEFVPTCAYTKINIGGPGRYLAEIDQTEDLIALVRHCIREKIRYVVLGHGSNVFFSDKGFPGLVIVNFCTGMKLTGKTSVRCESGMALSALNRWCVENSLTGFEFSSGIPGTIGGAIFGNAGAYGKNIGQCLMGAVVLMPDGSVLSVERDFFEFAYRDSSLKRNRGIVLSADFAFEKGAREKIVHKVKDILAMRAAKLPPEHIATAGSYFKNLKDEAGQPIPAAKYLESVGSKETVIGGMRVFEGHANIFVNSGSATADDLLKLERLLKKRVQEKYRLLLEREVMYLF